MPITIRKAEHGLPPHRYYADFGHKATKVDIEIDGVSHKSRVAKKKDARREGKLKQLGWLIVRFTDDQAWRNPKQLAKKAAAEVIKRASPE